MGDASNATEAVVRAEFRGWRDAHWEPERRLVDWRELLADSGWAVPSWPTQWHGSGLPSWADTIVAHGTDDLDHRMLR